MTRITTRLTAAAAAALTGLTLTACTADAGGPDVTPTSDEVTTSPAPSDSPSPEQSAVIVAPERPAAMDDDCPQGAEAAVRYFLALDSYMQATGDTTTWEAMSHPACEYCAGRLEQARSIAESGYSWAGGEATVAIDHTYQVDDATGIWPIDITAHQAAGTLGDSDGEIVSEIPAASRPVRAEVVRSDGNWLFVELAKTPVR